MNWRHPLHGTRWTAPSQPSTSAQTGDVCTAPRPTSEVDAFTPNRCDDCGIYVAPADERKHHVLCAALDDSLEWDAV